MRILEMMLPRLEGLARQAGDRDTTRHPVRLAALRDDYRYLASVCLNLLTELEPELAELPEPVAFDAPAETRVAYQMSLVRRANRLHRAVESVVERHRAARSRAANEGPNE